MVLISASLLPSVTTANLAAWAPLALLGALLAWVALLVLRHAPAWLRFRRLANRFPGPRPQPLLGNLLDGGRWNSPYQFLCNTLRQLQKHPAVQMWMGPLRVIFLSDPLDIQKFLCNTQHQRSPTSKLLQSTFGKGLITLSGDLWRRHQKIISPAFSTNILNSFTSVFDRQSNIFVERLRDHAKCGDSFNLEPMIDAVTFDSLCETVMGVQMNTQTQGSSEYFRAAKVKMVIAGERITRPWLLPEFVFRWSSLGRKTAPSVKEMNRRRDELIRERKGLLELNNAGVPLQSADEWGIKRRQAFLDMLLMQKAAGAKISDEEIGDEVDTFMLVGHDSTAAFFLKAFHVIAQHPDVQEKIVEELKNEFHSTDTLEITPDIIKKLTYLDMVIKEVFRLHPPVWFSTLRRAATDVTLPSNGLVIPAGADVVISLKAAHMNPQYYPNPEVFDPERFSPENSASRHPYAFIPFAGGQHICMGRRFAMIEAKTVIAKTLWNYEVLLDPSYKIRLDWAMATRPANGLSVRLRCRSR